MEYSEEDIKYMRLALAEAKAANADADIAAQTRSPARYRDFIFGLYPFFMVENSSPPATPYAPAKSTALRH